MKRRKRASLLAARERTHGDFAEVAELAQAIKDAYRRAPGWAALPAHVREALDMKATKTARATSGRADEVEHWRDDIGYSALVIERLAEPRRRKRRKAR